MQNVINFSFLTTFVIFNVRKDEDNPPNPINKIQTSIHCFYVFNENQYFNKFSEAKMYQIYAKLHILKNHRKHAYKYN